MLAVPRVVFALLVCATIGAFFVAQRLKRAPAVVDVGAVTRHFSPNGDGRRDRSRIAFTVQERDEVAVTVVGLGGERVRELLTGRIAEPGRPIRTAWDGRADDGRRAPDGGYRIRVSFPRQGRSVVLPGGRIHLDTTPPRPRVVRARPKLFEAGRRPVVMALRSAARRHAPTVEVWRTDGPVAEKVATVRGRAGRRRVVWDGRADGRPVPPGTYLLVPKVRDRAGNVGSTPASLPPDAAAAPRVRACRCQPGVTAWRLSAQLDQRPYRAGARVRVFVDNRRRAYSWRLRRIGTRARGPRRRARGSVLTFRAPEGPSGVHLLELRAPGQRLDMPVVVQSPDRAPFLVVLPATTWLGSAAVDDDFNGFPDRLTDGRAVKAPRPLREMPGGFADEIAPLLVFLDRARLRYDLTTDLALAGGRDPRPTDRPGVLLPGRHRWLPADVARRLRRYALTGGRVAVIGTEGLRRQVTAERGALVRPTAPTRHDLFGARVGDLRRGPFELVNTQDEVRLFEGTDGAISGVRVIEPVGGLSRRVRLAAAMGPETGDPAILALRVGDGLVVRIGVERWGATLCADAERAQLTRNAVDLLRGVRPKLRDATRGCGPEPRRPSRRERRSGRRGR